MDEDRYPTKEFLQELADYDITKDSVMGLVGLICDNWHFGGRGFHLKRAYKGKRSFELHTGGWSGNEEIIEVLESTIFWLLCWQKSYRGGHYYFKINQSKEE